MYIVGWYVAKRKMLHVFFFSSSLFCFIIEYVSLNKQRKKKCRSKKFKQRAKSERSGKPEEKKNNIHFQYMQHMYIWRINKSLHVDIKGRSKKKNK